MKLYNVLIALMILVMCSVGFVSAIDVSDFNPPKGFDEGFGNSMDYGDFSISVNDYDADLDYSDNFENTPFNNVVIKEDICEIQDSFHDNVGVSEIVKIGKHQYVVKCTYDGNDTSKINECANHLKEFNKKNDLTPLSIKKPDDLV